jgi:hypothetical protein
LSIKLLSPHPPHERQGTPNFEGQEKEQEKEGVAEGLALGRQSKGGRRKRVLWEAEFFLTEECVCV